MDKKDGVNCDPGWNDPPLFSYESQTAQLKTSKPRIFQNKRVAFPLHVVSQPSSNIVSVDPTLPMPVCDISTLPPPPSVPLASNKEISIQESKNADSDVFNNLQALEIVITNLSDVLISKFEYEEKVKSEIQRRLDTLRQMWVEEKLCRDIQLKLLELSEALKSDEIEKADYLQKGLMVDHAPSCSSWMSGVRYLLHHKETQLLNQEEYQ